MSLLWQHGDPAETFARVDIAALVAAPWPVDLVLGRAEGSSLVLDLGTGPMAWVLPGLAITWFLDRVREDAAAARLRAWLTAQDAAGTGLSLAAHLRTIPTLTATSAATIRAAHEWFAARVNARLAAQGLRAPDDGGTPMPWKTAARVRGLPVRPTHINERWELAEAEAVMIEAQTLPSPDLAWVAERYAIGEGSPFVLSMEWMQVARRLARAGVALLAYGDVHGASAIAQAEAMLPPSDQALLIETLVAYSVRALADTGRVVAACGRLLPAAHPFLTASSAPGGISGHAERVFLAEHLRRELAQRRPLGDLGRAWLGGLGEQGWRLDDLHQRLRTEGNDTVPPPGGYRTQWTREALASFAMISDQERRSALSADTAALILAVLALPTPRPQDGDDIARLLGRPLGFDDGEMLLPLRWARLPGDGIQLSRDVSGPRPEWVSAGQWRLWQPSPKMTGKAFELKLADGVFRWDPVAARAAAAPDEQAGF